MDNKKRNRNGEEDVIKAPSATMYRRDKDIEIGVENHAAKVINNKNDDKVKPNDKNEVKY